MLPIYMAALVWPVGALLLPPYRLSNLLILAGLSLIAYAVVQSSAHPRRAHADPLRHRQ